MNITTSANEWEIFGIGIGQTLFWVILGLAWSVCWQTPYRRVCNIALALALLIRGIELFSDSLLIHGLRVAVMPVLFVIAGAKIYGLNPSLIHKQLVVFLALCIPVMLLQISGADSFFMSWGLEYDPSVFNYDKLGTYQKIPVYPTLFVGPENLYCTVGQSRPVGLLYSNNPLSVFVAITAGLNFALPRESRLRFSDVIVSLSLVLTMSLLAFTLTILIYAFFIVFGSLTNRRRGIKLVSLLALFLFLYYLFFPGLFLINFSVGKIMMSILFRGLDLAHSLGISFSRNFYYDQIQFLGAFDTKESYSLYSILFKSSLAIPVVVSIFLLMISYYRRVVSIKYTKDTSLLIYSITLIVCLLSNFAVPYVGAPSFQLILGFALFPLFKKLWPTY
ncbi:MAG: hypothetical protein NTY07_09365 [Bacteroidia bacterium]|nr:hypothetical protein [Bacteroidia bacterium]